MACLKNDFAGYADTTNSAPSLRYNSQKRGGADVETVLYADICIPFINSVVSDIVF